MQYKTCKTAEQQKSLEREHGCRYSVLIELPYYDIIRFNVIDPMHNLLLGTAKRMMSVWISTGVIDKSMFMYIQEKVDAFVAPSNIGRIPSKITSGFSNFTAEQWRNWTLIFFFVLTKRTYFIPTLQLLVAICQSHTSILPQTYHIK